MSSRKSVGPRKEPWGTTKSKLETHSQKHIHGNTFGNKFGETHSNF